MKKVLLSSICSLVAVICFAENPTSVKSNSSNSTINVQAVLEENTQLKLEREALNNQVEELNARVNFSNVMSLVNMKLRNEELQNEKENNEALKNYNRLMFQTIINLTK